MMRLNLFLFLNFIAFTYYPFLRNLIIYYNSLFYFFYAFIILIIVMVFFFLKKNKINLNFDILYTYYVNFIKFPFKLWILTLNEFKKFYFFMKNIKYRNFFKRIFLFFKKKFSTVMLIWRPLFKKWSYFGFFRANRSKWIK